MRGEAGIPHLIRSFFPDVKGPRAARWLAALLIAGACLAALPAQAKWASIVVNARTGEILHGTNIDTRNYPASLTKMMTLFMVFEALETRKWSLAKRLKVSRRAARQPASKLGLQAGRTITVRDAMLALVTKSANDVATVIAENMSGSERNFALEMTAMARQIGMSRTTFRNASGLPHRGQMSTARDMARLAQVLIHRHGRFYHYFSTTSFRYGGRKYRNHNKLLTTYEGADGIKTGYIRASGFNLAASAKRGDTRLIGVVFGGNSSRHRNKVMTRLLNKGFQIIDRSRPAAPRIAKRAAPAPQRQTAKAETGTPPAGAPETGKAGTMEGTWGVQVGAYSRYAQAHESARVAIDMAPGHLKGGVIRIVPLKTRRSGTLYRSRIHGLGKRTAYAACKVLEKRNRPCMELRVKNGVKFAAARMR